MSFSDVKDYTRPVGHTVIDQKGHEGRTFGNYVVINNEGWIVTAAHVAMPDLQPEFIEVIYSWWTKDGLNLVELDIGKNDLAFGRIAPFDSKWVSNFPIFGTHSMLRSTTNLFGFGWVYKGNNLPYEPVLVETEYRQSVNYKYPWENEEGSYIETSTPFQLGMSGGPLINQEGILLGIISAKSESPVIPGINLIVGRTIHPDIIISRMDKLEIIYQTK